jgi:hypothetical protein
MFDRVTQEIARLSEFEQLDILRKMLEGVLTYQSVLETHGRYISNQFINLDRMLDYLQDSQPLSEAEKKAQVILREYTQRPIEKRVSTDTACHAELLRHCNDSSRVITQFKKVRTHDQTVLRAIGLYINLFAQSVYAINNCSTETMLAVFECLKADPKQALNTENRDLVAAVKRFQDFYNILTNSYLADSTRKYIILLIVRLLELEMLYRTPLNKAISMLTNMKNDLEEARVDKLETKFLFFGSKTPDSVVELRRILSEMPGTFDVLTMNDEACNKYVESIKNIFAQAYDIVENEKSKTFLKSKKAEEFWKDLYTDMARVKQNESEALALPRSIGKRR